MSDESRIPGTRPTIAAGTQVSRKYPDHPIVAVLAVVTRNERALIVQRANPPNKGRWGFPGGVLELGETVGEGAMRELLEETGVVAEPTGTLDVHDAVSRDDDGGVQFHYVLIAVRGTWVSGEGEPDDDAAACAWVTRDDIVAGKYPTFPTLLPLFDRALAAAETG